MFGKAFKATFGVGCALIIGIIIIIAIGGALGSKAVPSSGPTTAPISATQAPATAGAKTFVAVKTWSGSGLKNTEDFTVGDQWKIKWTSSSSSGLIQIYVYKSSDKSLVGLAANTQKSGADESIQRGGGTFYLTINAVSTDWTVTVEDLR